MKKGLLFILLAAASVCLLRKKEKQKVKPTL